MFKLKYGLEEHVEKNILSPNDTVAVQNITGKLKNTWSLSGVVVENVGHDSYWVKLDGSGRLTKRRRHHLKKIVPFLAQEILVPKEHVHGHDIDQIDIRRSGHDIHQNDIRRSNRLLQKSGGGGR